MAVRRACAVVVAAGLLCGATARGQGKAVFPAETRLVVLQATVKNRRGELVTTLDRDAFTVFEDGKRQPITLFRAEDVPVSLGLLIDNSGSMRSVRTRVEAAALACLRASNPEDEVFVLDFADKARVDVPLTGDVGAVEAGLARLDAIGGTAMRDAIEAGVGYLAEHGRRDRKALVVVSDGNDNASTVSIDEVRRQAEQHDIVIYAMGLAGDEASAGAKHGRHELDALTEVTGGVAYYPAGAADLDAAGVSIARQIRSQYTIGYRPADRSLDGSFRKLRVVARGPERLVVRTRAGFRAAAPRSSASPAPGD